MPPIVKLTAQVAPWLSELLSAYPGGQHGNAETRGLDSQFAVETYVESQLDRALKREIENKAVDLIILFGNAGDGKTAFLQHLVRELGAGTLYSSHRVLNHRLPDGRQLMVNLDGSAAWNGKSANELLDDVFRPFRDGGAANGRVHIVAVNSGKLLEWINVCEEEATPLLNS